MMNKKNKIIYIGFLIIIGFILWKLFLDEKIVFKITIDPKEIMVGESVKISYELNKKAEIKWESFNTDVARIADDKIIGVGVGTTVIRGVVSHFNETVMSSITISVYDNRNIIINDITIPNGELFITKNDSFSIPFEYTPKNADIVSIDYLVDDENIASFDGTIYAKNIGSTNASIKINNIFSKTFKVNVIDKKIDSGFYNPIEDINVTNDNIVLNSTESIKIEYTTIPDKVFIENIKWSSSDENIAIVDDGMITAKASGNAIITLMVNNIVKNIKVSVVVPVKEIKLYTSSNLVMKVGQSEIIQTKIIPDNATNKEIIYTNTNPDAVTVDSNGVIKATGVGKGTITISSKNLNEKKQIDYIINPKIGVIEGDGGIWGYSSQFDQIPERADRDFFQNLANNGQGVLKDNIYYYTDGDKNYSYDITKSLLTLNKRTVLTRFYYPQNVDLSKVNTFTVCGGTGNGGGGFRGFFKSIDENRNYIKSSGIIILVASKDGHAYNQNEIVLATEFVKAIVNQEKGIKNAIGAFSGSGADVGYAANNVLYDRAVFIVSYFWPNLTPNLVDKEIIIYSPMEDKLEDFTRRALNGMRNNNFKNVTVITNNNSMINDYKNDYLIINPGSKMGKGHTYNNILPGNVFAYACR